MCLEPAAHLHEIEPRSLRPKDWGEWGNRVTLCRHHHDQAHRLGTHNVAGLLRERAKILLVILD